MECALYIFVCQSFLNIIISKSHIIFEKKLEHIVLNKTFDDLDNKYIHNKTRRSLFTISENEFWNDGIIPYEIENVFSGSQQRIIKQAIREWEKSTCLKFVHRIQEVHPNYIEFTKEACGCCSFVGNKNLGKHTTSLSDGCLTPKNVLHELGHVIGLLHEHSRPDRDEYVKIKTDIIPKNYLLDYRKYAQSAVKTFGHYDHDSVMHYPEDFDGAKIIETIKQINGTKPSKIGQKPYLSESDIAGVNYFYNCPKCGSTFFESNGILSLPKNVEYCEWSIRAAAGERIKLDIKFFDIQNSFDCTDQSLEIRNGYLKNSPVIARHCGEPETATIIASNWLTVTFAKTQSADNNMNFTIQYSTLCSNEVYIRINESYYLESPNYPDNYKPLKQCEWYIKAPYKHSLLMKFDYFGLQQSEMCRNDFLEARDGLNQNAPLIGTYCGEKENLEISSLNNKMYLMFFSDGSIQVGGFSAVISAIPI